MPPPRSSAARLDALVQQAREPVFLLGPERRILLVNRAWEELTGHPPRRSPGLECHPHGPTRAGRPRRARRQLLPAPGGPGRPARRLDRTLILHADGERRWRRVEFWPFHDARGALCRAPRPGPARRRRRPGPRLRGPAAPGRAAGDPRPAPRPPRLRRPDRPGARASPAARPGRRGRRRPPSPVLIVGEPGTGKLLVARTIHQRGPRRQAPMLAYDCKALPPEVLERELFGAARPGRPAAAGRARRRDRADRRRPRPAPRPPGPARLGARRPGPADRHHRRRPRRRAPVRAAPARPLLRADDAGPPAPAAPRAARRAARCSPSTSWSGPTSGATASATASAPAALDALAAYDWPGNLRELARVVDDAHGRGDRRPIQLDDIPAAIRGHRGGAYNPPPRPPARPRSRRCSPRSNAG